MLMMRTVISREVTIDMKIRLSILLFMLVSILLSSCSSSPYAYPYPKEYSAEYCFEQYELFDPNMAYTECYEFVSEEDWGLFTPANFSAIRDCDDLSFMVYYQAMYFLGKSYSIQIVRSKEVDINPSADFTPLRAELFWYNENWADPEEAAEQYHDYDSHYLSQTALFVDSKDAIDEIMHVAMKETVLSYDAFVQEQNATPNSSELRGISAEGGVLYVKVYFAECDGLVLIGKIMTDENNDSYMEHIVYYANEHEHVGDIVKLNRSPVTDWRFYYRLGENMDTFVQQVMESMG